MDFNILECRHFIAPCSNSPLKRIVCNYEFDFYIKGERVIYIDDRTSKIEENSICFRRPGQLVSSIGDYDCYILTVDFSQTVPVENYLRNTAHQIEPEANNILINTLPDVFTPTHNKEIHTILSNLALQADLNSQNSHMLFEEFLFLINADLRHKSYCVNKSVTTTADKAINFINKHFCENICLEDIANYACVDKSYLVRLFKKQFSLTPINYIIECRLNYARNLLINTNLTISEISNMTGYNSTSFFITQFKKSFGISPHQYRFKIAKNDS